MATGNERSVETDGVNFHFLLPTARSLGAINYKTKTEAFEAILKINTVSRNFSDNTALHYI